MWIQYKKPLKQTELKVGVVQSYGKDCSLRALCHWTSSPGCQISYLFECAGMQWSNLTVFWSCALECENKNTKNTVLSCLSCRGTSDSWTCEEQCAGIGGGRQRHAASHLRVGATIIELQVEFNLHAVQNKRCGVYIRLSQLSLLIFLLSVQSSSAMTTLSVATWLGLLLLLACMDPTWWSRLRCVCLCISVMFCNCSECSFNFFFMMSSGWPLAGV